MAIIRWHFAGCHFIRPEICASGRARGLLLVRHQGPYARLVAMVPWGHRAWIMPLDSDMMKACDSRIQLATPIMKHSTVPPPMNPHTQPMCCDSTPSHAGMLLLGLQCQPADPPGISSTGADDQLHAQKACVLQAAHKLSKPRHRLHRPRPSDFTQQSG